MQKYRYLISIHSFGRNLQESVNNDKERIIMTMNGEENPIISVKSDIAAVIGDVSLYFALGVNYNVSL